MDKKFKDLWGLPLTNPFSSKWTECRSRRGTSRQAGTSLTWGGALRRAAGAVSAERKW